MVLLKGQRWTDCKQETRCPLETFKVSEFWVWFYFFVQTETGKKDFFPVTSSRQLTRTSLQPSSLEASWTFPERHQEFWSGRWAWRKVRGSTTERRPFLRSHHVLLGVWEWTLPQRKKPEHSLETDQNRFHLELCPLQVSGPDLDTEAEEKQDVCRRRWIHSWGAAVSCSVKVEGIRSFRRMNADGWTDRQML